MFFVNESRSCLTASILTMNVACSRQMLQNDRQIGKKSIAASNLLRWIKYRSHTVHCTDDRQYNKCMWTTIRMTARLFLLLPFAVNVSAPGRSDLKHQRKYVWSWLLIYRQPNYTSTILFELQRCLQLTKTAYKSGCDTDFWPLPMFLRQLNTYCQYFLRVL